MEYRNEIDENCHNLLSVTNLGNSLVELKENMKHLNRYR
jgi:hypothetical protein